VGAGVHKKLSTLNEIATTTLLNNFVDTANDWIFGNINYDYKNNIHNLTSKNIEAIGFDNIGFFIPKIVVFIIDNTVTIESIEDNCLEIYHAIIGIEISKKNNTNSINVRAAITKNKYLKKLAAIKNKIKLGYCYELTFCKNFAANNQSIDPIETYISLNKISPNPMSAFYKVGQHFLLCASPERFIKKIDNTLYSQPIKGTSKRDITNKKNDAILKANLQNSSKEQSENVMIVDLVRNDLSRICKPKTVVVNNLFGVYSFAQVHQMISTISGVLMPKIGFGDIIQAMFPMGSMTGAPKRKVMQLIAQFETHNRGIFSGTIGYISPNKDFDFNVVIRSIIFDQNLKKIEYFVGGAITFASDAESEYLECLLKAEAIKKVLEG
jgi:para-aminobenzoate synthetase component I